MNGYVRPCLFVLVRACVCKLVAVVTAAVAASMRNSINSTLHCLLLGECVCACMCVSCARNNLLCVQFRKVFANILRIEITNIGNHMDTNVFRFDVHTHTHLILRIV